MSSFGPECVKTLSYLECINQAFLGDAIAQAFAAISTTTVHADTELPHVPTQDCPTLLVLTRF